MGPERLSSNVQCIRSFQRARLNDTTEFFDPLDDLLLTELLPDGQHQISRVVSVTVEYNLPRIWNVKSIFRWFMPVNQHIRFDRICKSIGIGLPKITAPDELKKRARSPPNHCR